MLLHTTAWIEMGGGKQNLKNITIIKMWIEVINYAELLRITSSVKLL